jgi:hypothetical protein
MFLEGKKNFSKKMPRNKSKSVYVKLIFKNAPKISKCSISRGGDFYLSYYSLKFSMSLKTHRKILRFEFDSHEIYFKIQK